MRDRGLAWLYSQPWVLWTPVRIRAIPFAGASTLASASNGRARIRRRERRAERAVRVVRIRAIPSASARNGRDERSSSVGRFEPCESSCWLHPRGRDPWHSPRQPVKPIGLSPVVCSYEGVAHFGGDDRVSERPLPLAGYASLRAADGRACVGSRRERSPPFEVPPNVG